MYLTHEYVLGSLVYLNGMRLTKSYYDYRGYWKRVGDELAVRSDDLLVVDYKIKVTPTTQ
jgi:hypothetical protein